MEISLIGAGQNRSLTRTKASVRGHTVGGSQNSRARASRRPGEGGRRDGGVVVDVAQQSDV